MHVVVCRPPEAGNLNGHCPSVNGKSFDYWFFGMSCFNIVTGKFIQGKENKRESWENDFYPLLFKSFQHPTFSKLVNKAFPKTVFDAKKIEYCLNLIQGTLTYREKNRPSTV